MAEESNDVSTRITALGMALEHHRHDPENVRSADKVVATATTFDNFLAGLVKGPAVPAAE